MTVRELRTKLNEVEPDTEVVIYHEKNHQTDFYDIADIGLHTGKPLRHANGRPGFTFDRNGPAIWLFITAIEE